MHWQAVVPSCRSPGQEMLAKTTYLTQVKARGLCCAWCSSSVVVMPAYWTQCGTERRGVAG
jgi:hypothetical protein